MIDRHVSSAVGVVKAGLETTLVVGVDSRRRENLISRWRVCWSLVRAAVIIA